MPVAYTYIEEGPENTHSYHDDKRACCRSAEEERSSIEQLRSSMTADDNEEITRSSGTLTQARTGGCLGAESREELIARIKRDQRPLWPQSAIDETLEERYHIAAPALGPTTGLLPAIELNQSSNIARKTTEQRFELGSSIERPRSALHAGDFRQRKISEPEPNSPRPNSELSRPLWTSTSPTTPWYSPQIYQSKFPSLYDPQSIASEDPNARIMVRNHRTLSYSARPSSFIFRPPTSPLAVHSNSNDVDYEEFSQGRNKSPDKSYRRRTFSPGSLQHLRSTFDHDQPQWPVSLRREESFPYQAHQPLRSFTGTTLPQSESSLQPSPSRLRRPSTSGDSSFMQHAPMVGRYEESILRGRMSTLPSKPLDFVAQIGVLGKGNCKPSLKCPPHVTVQFPAVFYDYKHPHDHRLSASEGPSPYVGQVDLENNPKNTAPSNTLALGRSPSPDSDVGSNCDDSGNKRRNHASSNAQIRRRQTSKRTPRGSYRIPQQGQLQIVIKNPNKTAVKLFLVPYDLVGMESGQKTFIRQRSYSAGPIIDMPLSARSNLGTDRPEAALSSSDNPEDRPILRYLIHLHICCPSRGRYYLYKSIRIVFANRVPDGKEKLRVETQLPEPRYSAYKPDITNTGFWNTRHVESPRQQRRVSSPTHGKADDAFPFDFTSEPARALDRVLPEPKPVFGFPRLPPQRALSRISSNGSSVPSEPMSFDIHNDQMSPKTIAPSRLQSPISWTSTTSSKRSLFDAMDRSPSPAGRPAREGLLAQQLKDWAEQSRSQPQTGL